MIPGTSKKTTQTLLLGLLLAPMTEKRLKAEYQLTRLEQHILLLTNWYQEQGFKVNGSLLIAANISFHRNVREGIKNLVDSGYIERKRVVKRQALEIKLTDKGLTFVSRSLSVVRQQYKSLL